MPDGHHDLSHHGGDAAKHDKIRKINRFHVAQLAYLLAEAEVRSRRVTAPCWITAMIVYGSGISDGNAHSHDDLPILLAGRANGTVKTGRHIRFPQETPLTNLYVSMLNRMGVPTVSFGDSTGELNAIAG